MTARFVTCDLVERTIQVDKMCVQSRRREPRVLSTICAEAKGLMTMWRCFGNPEAARLCCCRATNKLFDDIGTLDIPGVETDILSTGMSNAHCAAIREGPMMICLGAVVFGGRVS